MPKYEFSDLNLGLQRHLVVSYGSGRQRLSQSSKAYVSETDAMVENYSISPKMVYLPSLDIVVKKNFT